MVPKSKRKPNEFDVERVAGKIYKAVCVLCRKSIGYYPEFLVKDMARLAGEVAEHTRKGNFIPKDVDEFRYRRFCFLSASGSLSALSGRIDVYLEYPELLQNNIGNRKHGVHIAELNEIADFITKEEELLNGILKSDTKRFGSFAEAASNWWLRSANSDTNFRYVNNNGNNNNNNANNSNGVAV